MWRTTKYFIYVIYNNGWHIANGSFFGCPYFIMICIGGKRHDHISLLLRQAQDPGQGWQPEGEDPGQGRHRGR